MKKTRGLDRALPAVSRAELEAWPTGALLARLKRLRWCEEDAAGSDLTSDEVASVSRLILFKNDPAWRTAYGDLTALLARREHKANKP